MSVSLSNVQQKIFDEQVKKAYKSKGFLLRNTVRMRENVDGDTVQFRKAGSIQASQYAFQTQVSYSDPNFQKVEVSLESWRAATLVDDIQRFLVNFDERQEDAEIVARALGRRSDQLIIDALNNSGTSNTIADGSAGLTYAKVREVVKFFEDNAVPPEDRFFAISAKAQDDIFNVNQFTSSDFNNLNAVPNGSLNGNFVMGMNWIVIPSMDEGGLPKSGNIRSCFAWHKMAMGMGIGQSFTSQIERVAHFDSFQILGKMYANATSIDSNGVVKCDIDESV